MSSAVAMIEENIVRRASVGSHPIPLIETKIDVEIHGGLAIISTERIFRNVEKKSIEACMTFPVAIDSVVTGMYIEIDGRKLNAKASPRHAARETYEKAIDSGKTAFLHEELFPGIHMVSVGNLAPKKQVLVKAVTVSPLTNIGSHKAQVRIPMTVGHIYGQSPMPDSDDLVTGADVVDVRVSCRTSIGQAYLGNKMFGEEAIFAPNDRSISIVVKNWQPSAAIGSSWDGRHVKVDLKPIPNTNKNINAEFLFDVSGSMSEMTEERLSKLSVVKEAATEALSNLLPDDHVGVSVFNTNAKFIGESHGKEVLALIDQVKQTQGGTQIGTALKETAGSRKWRDIILITDGRSYDGMGNLGGLPIHEAIHAHQRVHVVMIGKHSLEANAGRIASMTGGNLIVVDGQRVEDMVEAFNQILNAARVPTPKIADRTKNMPVKVDRFMAGMALRAQWAECKPVADKAVVPDIQLKVERAIGAFAAWLALPLMQVEEATKLSANEGLCSHLTSLVMVDEAGEQQEGLPEHRKVALARPGGLMVSGVMRGISIQASGFASASNKMSLSANTSDRGSSWDDNNLLFNETRFKHGKNGLRDNFDKPFMPFPARIPNAWAGNVGSVNYSASFDKISIDWNSMVNIDWSNLFQCVEDHGNFEMPFLAVKRLARSIEKAVGLNYDEILISLMISLAQRDSKTDRQAARIYRRWNKNRDSQVMNKIAALGIRVDHLPAV